MTTQTINVGNNHYLNSSSPTTAPTLTNQVHSGSNLWALYQFVLPAAPVGEALTSASLAIRTTTGTTAGSAVDQSISLTTSAWDETSTWNTRPTVGSVVGTITAPIAFDTALTVALDTSVIGPLAGTTIGLVSNSATATDSMVVWSSRYTTTAQRPVLTLTYAASTFTAPVTATVTVTAAPVGVPTGLSFPTKAAADALYTPAPTISVAAQATTTISGGVLIPPDDARITYRGAGLFSYGATFPDTTLYAPASRYPRGRNTPPPWGWSFNLTGNVVEFMGQVTNATYSSFRVRVDGQRVTDLAQLMSAQTPVIAAGGRFVLKLTFPTSATRRVTIESSYMQFGGLFVGAGNTVAAIAPFHTRCTILGDSITASASFTTGLGNGVWFLKFANYAGIDDPWNQAIGGTGYQSATATTFINRIADVSDFNPKVVIYWGGYNDRGFTAASNQSAASAVFAAGLAAEPTAEHYVIGCWSPQVPPVTSVTDVDGAIKAAAAANGLPFASPVDGKVYNGAGTLIGTYEPIIRTTGDITTMIGTDNTHPTDAGNVRIAEWMREVFILMAGAPSPFVAAVNVAVTVNAALSSLTAPSATPGRAVGSFEQVPIKVTAPVVAEAWEYQQTAGPTTPLAGGFGDYLLTGPATWLGTSLSYQFRYQFNSVMSDWSPVSTFTVGRQDWWQFKGGVDVPLILGSVGAAPPPPVPDPGLFFDLPATYTGDKLYLAHFYPPYPKRITNSVADGVDLASSDYYSRNYLNPTGGSETANAPFGGVLRSRPMPLPVVASGLWEADNARREIQEALSVGLDGFLCNTTNTSGANLLRIQQLRDMAVAEFPGFIVTPMLDTSSASALSTATAASVAALISTFAKLPCTKYLPDGRMLIGSFQGDTQTVAWWTSLMSTLSTSYNITIAVTGAYNAFSTAVVAHASVLYAAGQWGYGADPAVQTGSTGLAGEKAAATAQGVKNMRSIWMQDIRPFASVYDEACNTEALRVAWGKAITDDVPLIQLCTWSDFKEGSAFMNSESRGMVGADISAFYATWWKQGAAPTILKDAAYLTHRQAPLSAVPTGAQTVFMQQWKPPINGGRNNTSVPREQVEALVFLTSPAEVRITSNGSTQAFTAPAGMSAWLKPAGLGDVKVEVWRGAVNILSVLSPITVSSSWPNDHREYAAFGSVRGTVGQRASWPRVAPNTTSVSPWLPFEMPTTESLQLAAAQRGVIFTSHPMGGSWVTPQQTVLDTDPDYTDKNYLYYPALNRVASGLTSAGSTITETATPLVNGDVLFFTAKGAATNIVLNTVYFVVGKATNTFQVAATSGGAAIVLGTATGIAYTKSTLKNLYGGEWRDRYNRRPTRPEASGVWQVKDIEWEINAAQAAGLNAFTWGTSTRTGTEWTRLQYALKAASNHNAANPTQKFYIIPWPLSLSSITGTPSTETPTVSGQVLADLFTGLINDPQYTNGFYRRNGRVLFMPYSPNSAQAGTGSSATPAAGVTTSGMEFWQAIDARMTANGTPADWYQVFQSNWTGLPPFYESTGAAMGHFGSRDFNTTLGENSSYRQARVFLQTTLGMTYRNAATPLMPYIAPISHQAFVPRGTPTQVGGNGIVWESGGTQNLTNSCLSAIDQYTTTTLNVVNLNTWNDFAEGSAFTPSKGNGFHWLDLWSWYMVRMATGTYPSIVRDGLYLTHRKQKTTGTTYTSVQKKFAVGAGTPSGASFTGTAWIDILDVVVFLTAAASVEVTSGGNAPVTFALTAGMSRVSVPLAVGVQSAKIIRGSGGGGSYSNIYSDTYQADAGLTVVVSVTSPTTVSSSLLVQDLTYYGTSNFANVARPVPVIPN